MRGGARALAWAAIASIGILVPSCGGDDDMGEPNETPDAKPLADVAAGDVSSDRPTDTSVAADTSRPPDVTQDVRDGNADRAPATDARDVGASAEAAPDGSDGRAPTTDAMPDARTADVRPDVPVMPDAPVDGQNADAGDGPNALDVLADAADAATDGTGSDAPLVGDSGIDVIEASSDDGGDAVAGDADGAPTDGGGLPAQSWQIGSGAVCSTVSPGLCADDPDVTNTFTFVQQALSSVLCSSAPSMARLWFASGGPPAPGDYTVLAATSDVDAVNVPTGQVIVALTAMSTTWWASGGSVHVDQDGTDLVFTFQNLPGSDGTDPALLAGHVTCTP